MHLKPYFHKAQYYETDKLGMIHHSNFIRWMEEARVDMMDQMGYPYSRMEEEGVNSPLLTASCRYKSPVQFSDTVRISCKPTAGNGIRITFSYRMEDANTGALRATGETEHCFTNAQGQPVNLKKIKPELLELLHSISPEMRD